MIVMKKQLIFLICLTFSIGSSPGQSKELRVGLATLDYPPFYFETDGQFHGAALEIVQELATSLDHKLVFFRVPWKRLQSYLKDGSIDMMILYFKTTERATDVLYTEIPHIQESSDLFVLSGRNIPYKGSLDDVASFRFGNVKGYSHGNEYNNAKDLHKQQVNNEKLLLKILLNNRIDIGVGNKPVIIHYAKIMGLRDKIRFLDPPIDVGSNYIAFSKARDDAQQLANEFSTELKAFVKTKKYMDILSEYHFIEQ